MKLQKQKIANSRFLFIQLEGDLNSWQGVLGRIDNFIKDESKFEWANPYAYIYFLPENNFLVGREVIGPPQMGDGNSPHILDFLAGEIFSYLIDNCLDLKENDLLNLKNRICQENVGEIDISLPWRIRIDLEKEDSIPIYFEFFGQNYPFPKLTN